VFCSPMLKTETYFSIFAVLMLVDQGNDEIPNDE
jgi:hypothetical protein